VAYLRSGLVIKRGWVDDQKFVEYLAISQTLPGLNATNMAVLVGDRLRGFFGALAAIVAICLPGAVLMLIAGALYQSHGDKPLVTAMLRGVAAAAVGLILATTIQLGKKSLAHVNDLIFGRPDGLRGRSPSPVGAAGADRRRYPGNPLVPSPQIQGGEPMNQIIALIRVFSYLSILTVGGGLAAFPEMKVLTVDVHKWLTFPQLIHLYSMGQSLLGRT